DRAPSKPRRDVPALRLGPMNSLPAQTDPRLSSNEQLSPQTHPWKRNAALRPSPRLPRRLAADRWRRKLTQQRSKREWQGRGGSLRDSARRDITERTSLSNRNRDFWGACAPRSEALRVLKRGNLSPILKAVRR